MSKPWEKRPTPTFDPLPPDWPARRRRVLVRDGRICYVCGGPNADEVDHVIPRSRGGTHDESNLRAIHASPCHASKTGREARGGTRRRPEEPHPGLVNRGGGRGWGGPPSPNGTGTGGIAAQNVRAKTSLFQKHGKRGRRT
jgi:hypothetical protein